MFPRPVSASVLLFALCGLPAPPTPAQGLVFADGFECGDTSVWGEASGQPACLPTLGQLDLYSTSPLRQPIGSNPTIDPGSAGMVAGLVSAAAGGFVISLRQYSAPVYFADASTPRRTVEVTCGPVWEMGVGELLGIPIPPWTEAAEDTDGAGNPPVGCGEDSDQDNHLVILDPTTRCEYDFWQARQEGGEWVASWGNTISMDGDGIYEAGLSTRGSGFAFLGGLLWPDELARGQIDHALVFNYPWTRSGGPVAPATDTDGWTSGASSIPEGARVQLDPSLDLDTLGLEPYERTIAAALQTYGMFLVDTGGSAGLGLYAIDPRSVTTDPWAGLLPDADFPELPNIPVDGFRVLELPPTDPGWPDDLDLLPTPCATWN